MGSQAPLDLMVDGYRGAFERLAEVVRNPASTADQAFIPLFEALNWAASIDLFFHDTGKPVGDDLLTGVRFARNRVHHQWAKALKRAENPGVVRVTLATSRSRRVDPPPGFWWYWIEADQLPLRAPPVRTTSGEPEYIENLAGKPADATLQALRPVLENLI